MNEIDRFEDDLRTWRRDLHAHPELAFEEERTAARVAELLESFGYEVHTGIGGTGVVGVLQHGESTRSLGLRADMDALPIQELNEFAHRSTHDGVMHACGHDGHTTMLLGAARYLAETRRFDGVVHVIFQPAEERGGGAREMIRDGVLERFDIEQLYGMHNFPGLPVGDFALCDGPMMAAADMFEAAVVCRGGHAAFPHGSQDAVVVASQILQSWQTIVSRETDPLRSAVLSVTQLHGGDAFNVLPERVTLGGCVRTFEPTVQDHVEKRMRELGEALCAAHEMRFEFEYQRYYPATVNHTMGVERVAAAAGVVGERVDTSLVPIMGSEDFSFFLQERPGAFVMVGQGESAGLHTPLYDFNDDILTLGAKFWATLVEQQLPPAA